MADCEPDPAVDGDTVICDGLDTDGFASAADSLIVTVEAGAEITTDPGSAIVLSGAGTRFTNRGTISGNPDFAFDGVVTLAGAAGITGVNEGDISVFGSGVALDLGRGVTSFLNAEGAFITSEGFLDAVDFELGFSGTFTNSGTIRAQSGRAIDAFTSSTTGTLNRIAIINTETGLIESLEGTAVNNFGGDFLDIQNSGTIRGVTGVNIDEGSILTNEAGGIVEGIGANGIAVRSSAFGSRGRATFVNHGVVRADHLAVGGFAYLLNNTGDIFGNVDGGDFGGIAEIVNSGTIEGEVTLGGDSDSFENTGTVTGTILLEAGHDVYRDFGGTVSGGVDLGAGDDFFLVRTDVARGVTAGQLTPGEGYDSFGISVEGVETVTLEAEAGFEGLAVEARHADSEATLAGGSGPLTRTVSAFGDGTVINLATIQVTGQEAIRLYSNISESFSGAPPFVEGPFGEGVTFINEGVIEGGAGVAVQALPAPGVYSQAGGHDRFENRNIITGDIFLAGGNDVFINAGATNGTVDLGTGDDFYFTDLTATDTASVAAVAGGSGFDAIGYYTDGTGSTEIGLGSDFEAAAVFAEGADSSLEITGVAAGQTVPFLRVLGDGTVINRAAFGNDGSIRRASAEVISDGATFENHAAIVGFQAIRMSGDNQTTINNANLFRGSLPSDSTGNTGFILDAGTGNTFINNGTIEVDAFSMSAVFVGQSAFPLNSMPDSGTPLPVTRIVNNGVLQSTSRAGIRLITDLPVEIVNNGTIDDIQAERSPHGITIHNAADGVIGPVVPTFSPTISINGSFSPSRSEGEITIVNDGTINGGIVFRDSGEPPAAPGGFDDTIINAGTIEGDVSFGLGDDAFTTVAAGTVTGMIDGDDGFDIAFFEAHSGDVIVDNFVDFERLDISADTIAVIGDTAGIGPSFTELFVRQGRVNIETGLALDVTVLGGGILGGNGTILGQVISSGTVAPGASIGSLTIDGDTVFDPASVLEIEFSTTENDLLTVNGSLTLQDGTLALVALDGQLTSQRSFQFLSASGGIDGSFGTIDLEGSIGFVELFELSPGLLSVTISPGIPVGALDTDRARIVAEQLNQFIADGTTSSAIDDILSGLFALGTGPELEDGLLALLAEPYAAASAIALEHSLLTNDLVRGRLFTFAERERGKNIWMTAAGSFAHMDSAAAQTGFSVFDVDSSGIVGGAEFVGASALLGGFAGYLQGDQAFDSLSAETSTSSIVVGAYGGWRPGAFRSSASIAYLLGDADTDREVAFLSQSLTAEYGLNALTAQGLMQYDLPLGSIVVSPFAGVHFIRADREDVVESGGSAALAVASQTDDFLFVDFGGRAAAAFDIGREGVLRTSVFAGWRHELFGETPFADATLAAFGDFSLASPALSFGRDRILFGADVSGRVSRSVDVFVRYSGEFGDDGSENRITGGLEVRF